jgi:hypothetical protein
MAKRQPLTFDNDDLTKNLKESAGNGLDAFFSTTPLPQAEKPKTEPVKEIKQESKKVKMIKTKKETKKVNNITSNMTSNITILQFTDDEIDELREPVHSAQTYRLTERDIEWVKDIAYRLNKEVKRGKVTQADIVRIAFRLFANVLEINKADLIKILERIK